MKLNRNGFAIGMVLIVVFILMMAGATFLFRMQGGVTSISVIEKSTKATYLAEAGISLASAYLRSYGICFESGLTLPERSLDGGTFNTAMSRKTPNSTLITILSVGSYSGTSKAVMVQALCMPAATTTPVILTQNFTLPQLFADYSAAEFFIPDTAYASPAARNYPSQIIYFRVAEDNELEKIASTGGKKNTAKDMLGILIPVIEGERRFFMENSMSAASDKKYSNIFGQKIKIPAEPGSVETLITAGSKIDKAREMTAVMETIDRIVAASLYSKLWNEDSMTVELFREAFGDACDLYAACGNHLVKSGQPFSTISNHIIFSGLPGIPIVSYNSSKKSIENAMPAVLVYDSVKPPDFNGQAPGAIRNGPGANNAPVRRTTPRDAEPILNADTIIQLEEKLADKIAADPAVADIVENQMNERGREGNGRMREARARRQERNRGNNNGRQGGGNNGNRDGDRGNGNNNNGGGHAGNNNAGGNRDGDRGNNDGGRNGGGGGNNDGPGRRN